MSRSRRSVSISATSAALATTPRPAALPWRPNGGRAADTGPAHEAEGCLTKDASSGGFFSVLCRSWQCEKASSPTKPTAWVCAPASGAFVSLSAARRPERRPGPMPPATELARRPSQRPRLDPQHFTIGKPALNDPPGPSMAADPFPVGEHVTPTSDRSRRRPPGMPCRRPPARGRQQGSRCDAPAAPKGCQGA